MNWSFFGSRIIHDDEWLHSGRHVNWIRLNWNEIPLLVGHVIASHRSSQLLLRLATTQSPAIINYEYSISIFIHKLYRFDSVTGSIQRHSNSNRVGIISTSQNRKNVLNLINLISFKSSWNYFKISKLEECS